MKSLTNISDVLLFGLLIILGINSLQNGFDLYLILSLIILSAILVIKIIIKMKKNKST